MRLICPNCSAQYEIDASLIPDEGRDVQCSNCGHNWYELPPPPEVTASNPDVQFEPDAVAESEPESDTDTDTDTDTETAVVVEDDPATDIEPGSEPLATAPDEDLPEEIASQESEPHEETPSPSENEEEDEDDWNWPQTRAVSLDIPKEENSQKERQRRPAELAALEILKEEADRELARREEEAAAPIESQPDLALDDPRDRDTPSRALRARMARLRGEDEDEEENEEADLQPEEAPEEDDAYREPRKDLLPDIDEINSSLRPAGLAGGQRSEEEEAEHRRGFRIGFIGIVALVVLLIVTYTQAPTIASLVPGTETALIGYVDWANGVRDTIGGLFGG